MHIWGTTSSKAEGWTYRLTFKVDEFSDLFAHLSTSGSDSLWQYQKKLQRESMGYALVLHLEDRSNAHPYLLTPSVQFDKWFTVAVELP